MSSPQLLNELRLARELVTALAEPLDDDACRRQFHPELSPPGLQQLEQTGRAWEWCGNSFHPYAGFWSFPDESGSQPWFDGGHYTLRGGSLHTRPSVRRPSFRNFYRPGMRHIFAGLRLVY